MSPGERFVDGLEARAGDLLPEPVHRYVRQGSRDGVTAGEAVAAWDRHRFLPQVLRDVTRVHTGTSLLGTYVDTPLAVAPTTMQRAAHPEGEVAMARGAREAGALLVVSSNAGVQLRGRRRDRRRLVAAGLRHRGAPGLPAAAAPGRRRGRARPSCSPWTPRSSARSTTATARRCGTSPSPAGCGRTSRRATATRPGEEKATDLGPQDVEWLARETGLPVVVKGVLRRGRRTTLRRRGRPGGVGDQPRRPAARPRRRHRLVPRRGGRRRSGRAPRCTSTAAIRSRTARPHGPRTRRRGRSSSAGCRSMHWRRTGPTGVRRMFARAGGGARRGDDAGRRQLGRTGPAEPARRPPVNDIAVVRARSRTRSDERPLARPNRL